MDVEGKETSECCHLSRRYESIAICTKFSKLFLPYMQIVDASSISGNPYLETEDNRKDVATFCKRIKFEEFGLEVWLFGWPFRANTSNIAMKEAKFPNTQGRRPFTDLRQTVLLLYISFSFSVFPVISVDVREKWHPFLPAFCGFPLKLRYSRNYSSSLTKM